MTAPLKPCPFCGGSKIDGGYNEYGGFVSICANCDTYGPPAAEMSKDAIIEAWNTRADALELLLEGLRQIVREFGGTTNGHRACVIANETIAKWEAAQ